MQTYEHYIYKTIQNEKANPNINTTKMSNGKTDL